MGAADETVGAFRIADENRLLTTQWRSLTRAATAVALLTSPALFVWFHNYQDWSIGWSLAATAGCVVVFRGLVDITFRKFIPWPSLFGQEEAHLKEEDVVARRRAWFWLRKFRLAVFIVVVITIVWLFRVIAGRSDNSWFGTFGDIFGGIGHLLSQQAFWVQAVIFPVFFLFNFLILFGPLALMGITQIRGFEPGDADWGVKLDDVRGQMEAKEEVRKIVTLWQSGERFIRAGGKRERGILFLGAPGTGKTMLAKGIATGFNCFAGDERYLTRDGVKSFAETVGTTQQVLNRDGEWVPAEIRGFGVQPLVEVELRPGDRGNSYARQHVRVTPDHRWFTLNRGLVTDLRRGDHVPFNRSRDGALVVEAFIRGFGYGDGTLDARGRARIRLCGEKDSQYLPLFERYGHCFVTRPPSFNGDPLVVFNGGHMGNWKELPREQQDPAWLASWLDGYLAADGWWRGDSRVLETQNEEAAHFVAEIAALAGYMVVGHTTRAAMQTNYGTRTAPLRTVSVRQAGLWRVTDVRSAGEEEVFCAVEPKTQTFTLACGALTGNCPFISVPGSGFAQTFIGMDVVVVRYLARKAKKLAAKWGGQCIVFIDEIDAIGMRRAALGGAPSMRPMSIHDVCFHGPNGAITATGDVIIESAVWREKLFAQREAPPAPPESRWGRIVNQAIPGMFGGGGQLALNQLLVVMDGIDNPPFMRRWVTSKINTWLDASFIVPRRIGGASMRLPTARPTGNQIYFIGATNVPIEVLDPALTRAGRMGRHVWFRTPTKNDRIDIFDLYLDKVAHDPELDTDHARDELARITAGYSPAMIEQVTSLALTYAQHESRLQFSRPDILEAMTTLEAGTAIGWEYDEEEARAVAIHEAGHATAGHVYLKDAESTRLSIRRRGFTGGHYQAREKEERFVKWRNELYGDLVLTLGAMAAEYVFYGQNTNGVGGDVDSATTLASIMAGSWAMSPPKVQFNGGIKSEAKRRETEQEITRKFQEIGSMILRRTGTGPMEHNPTAATLGDPGKREVIAQLLGRAFVDAYLLMLHNKEGVEKIADAVIEQKEIYGDDLLAVLNAAKIKVPEVDLTKDESWPSL